MGNIIKSTSATSETPDDQFPADNNDVLIVLFDYPPPAISEPIFRMGEKLRILSQEGDWWRVHSFATGYENHIPNTCVARVYHGWLFEGVGRQKAEELLELPANRLGSFMVRQSDSQRGSYCLSVRHYSQETLRCVKHYRIFRLPNKWYYIQQRLTFQCLEDMVNHYSEVMDGLCCLLTHPCLTQLSTETPTEQPIVMRRSQFNWRNVNRRELLSEEAPAAREQPFLSYGLRHSIASYMSLVQAEAKDEDRYTFQGGSHRKKTVKPDPRNRRTCLLTSSPEEQYEEDEFEFD
uniref:Src-like-adapter-like protein n=1 Tax=Callorhinchus milii TaxID=7868 RepID=V9L132_CALMI|eukprot:gi/632987050/ref/XP_007910580.1/ PREDICTED: src-like-adapter [Callorhinchus milii]